MLKYYKIEDEPQNWYTLFSQLTAGNPTSLKRAYGPMANAVHKLKVIKLAAYEKQLISEAHHAKMAAMQSEIEAMIKEDQIGKGIEST